MDFDQIDKLIHEKGRLAIMTVLSTRTGWPFQDLKAELKMSDGNLVSHLRTLHQAGYVSYTKDIPDRPQTTYNMTLKGRTAFKKYIDLLEALILETGF
jgi:DNA-binding MarR family transcriptional regulator